MEQFSGSTSNYLLQKYSVPAPRYTSYPTANHFHTDFDSQVYLECVDSVRQTTNPLSLYFHIPFCTQLCFYCGCNKVISNSAYKKDVYIEMLVREIEQQGQFFGHRPVVQLHFGGGTPTSLNAGHFETIMHSVQEAFHLLDDAGRDYSIEIDPRYIEEQVIPTLHQLGMNRASLGVQDFHEETQKAINRVQPYTLVKEVVDELRQNGFESINLDLIYGLPYQTVESFSRTVEQIIEIRPERLSLFNYAHLPSLFKSQRILEGSALPDAKLKLEIFNQTGRMLEEAGYRYIGMDHFALPEDELCLSQNKGQLHRNFQGYTVYPDCDIVAMGVSAISSIGRYYFQNTKEINAYHQFITDGRLATLRGAKLNDDDMVRRFVIMMLMCNFVLYFEDFQQRYHVAFADYFALEQEPLNDLAKDGLIEILPDCIRVSDQGRRFIRNICVVFDCYFQKSAKNHSKAV